NKVPFAKLVPTIRSSLLYVMNWGFGHNNAAPGFPRNSFIAAEYTHFWSLAVEFQFYLALPLVIMVMYRLKLSKRAWLITFGVLMAGAAIARAVQWQGAANFPGPYVYTHTRADALLWGVVCALLLHWGWVDERFQRVLAWAGPAAVGYLVWVICAHSAMDAWTYDWGMIFSGLSGAIIVLWLVSSPTNPLARFLGWRPVVYLGERSYSGYLWHYPVYFFINAHLHVLTGRERVAAGVAITIALSDLTFRIVERPVFSLKDRLIPRRIPAAVPDLPEAATAAG
ncbi:MAG TPA: acyltransferase, partial [Acidimicrobiales bacterium]